MPPVTPSAMRAMSTPNWRLDVSLLYFDDLAAQDFLLRDGDLLIALFARHSASEQLPGTFAREDDEFEPVFLGCSFHDVLSWDLKVRLCVHFQADLKVRLYVHARLYVHVST